jgi:3-methylfumaryl-CoA hydratase
LWFVTLNHEYRTKRGRALQERQDIVYREAKPSRTSEAKEAAPAETERNCVVRKTLSTAPTLLFRYSALTFNGHRIHYDLPYATGAEGYRGLVVHGPLQATLLLNVAAADYGARLSDISYRAVSPAIAGEPLSICANGGGEAEAYWTQSAAGRVHVEAKVTRP